MTTTTPQPQPQKCSWCSHIYPRARLYSRNCPRKRQLLSTHTPTQQQQHAYDKSSTLATTRYHHHHYHQQEQLDNKTSRISVYELVQAASCGDSEMLREILYSERFSSDPQRRDKAMQVLAVSLYSRQFSIFDIMMSFHKQFSHILDLDSAIHYFAIKRHEPLLVTAARMNYVNGVRKMLDGGARVDAIDSVRRTALWTACNVKRLTMVELLLDYGADVDIADDNGVTPLMVCVRAREPPLDIIETLLRNGSSVNGSNCKRSIFTLLLHKTDGKLVKMVCELCLLTPWKIFETIQNFMYTFPNIEPLNRRNKLSLSYEYLKHSIYSKNPVVPTLKQQCRKVVREEVQLYYSGKLENGLELLPLPKILKLFVQMKDMEY